MENVTTRDRLDAAWSHLGGLWDALYPSERETYTDALYSSEIKLWEGDELGAVARLGEVREWVNVWALPRLRGENPPPCDPFGLGASCVWVDRPTKSA